MEDKRVEVGFDDDNATTGVDQP
jgi:hypothetical protein